MVYTSYVSCKGGSGENQEPSRYLGGWALQPTEDVQINYTVDKEARCALKICYTAAALNFKGERGSVGCGAYRRACWSTLSQHEISHSGINQQGMQFTCTANPTNAPPAASALPGFLIVSHRTNHEAWRCAGSGSWQHHLEEHISSTKWSPGTERNLKLMELPNNNFNFSIFQFLK